MTARKNTADVLDTTADDTTDDTDTRPWTVRSRDGKRVYFEGTEDDAAAYVQANFPHVHAEPGNTYPDGIEPDVYLHTPDGDRHGFINGEWTEYDNDNK